MSSGPRTKRQFAGAASDPAQRQITSFFCPRQQHTSSWTATSTPPLPASVQANLLTVGMRVRKSVPEGYKTGPAYSAFKLWSDDSSFPSLQINTQAVASSRELLPFCGIHRIGGMATQPGLEDAPELDDGVPSLTSSQETVASTQSQPDCDRSSRKRFFDEDDPEQPVRVWQDRDDWLDGEVSPRSLAPVGWGNARKVAVPRRSRRKGATVDTAWEQENMAVDDFEDAEFLDYLEMDMSDG